VVVDIPSNYLSFLCLKLCKVLIRAGGPKIHASGHEGWYVISGLGHIISCQTRNTIESLLKVKVARTRT